MAIELSDDLPATNTTKGNGTLVLVVGPSGAGKDSIINGARLMLQEDPHFVFPRRIITRAVDETEDHAEVSVDDFQNMKRNGAFLFDWNAHGLSYGIPSGVADELAFGKAVIVNVSRSIAEIARLRFDTVVTLEIDAPEKIRVGRLTRRGRETAPEKAQRIKRKVEGFSLRVSDVRIVNDGPLSEAIGQFVHTLRKL